MVTQQVSKLKRKKKKWCPILAPKLLGHKVLGETFVADASLMNGRSITLNLMNITGEMKSQNVNATFKVQTVTDGKAYTELVSYEMISSSLRRFVRRGRSRVDDSFILKTADKKFVRIKPVIVTNSLATKFVRTQLRLQARNMLFSIVSRSTYETLVSEVVFQKIQKQMRDVLKKIFPVKSCGLRMFTLLEKEPKHYLASADYKIKRESQDRQSRTREEFEKEDEEPAEEVAEQETKVKSGVKAEVKAEEPVEEVAEQEAEQEAEVKAEKKAEHKAVKKEEKAEKKEHKAEKPVTEESEKPVKKAEKPVKKAKKKE